MTPENPRYDNQENRPSTDSDRLRFVADWLDRVDDLLALLGGKSEPIRKLSEATYGSAMQSDLRELADRLEPVQPTGSGEAS
jgi:hypothetical protein